MALWKAPKLNSNAGISFGRCFPFYSYACRPRRPHGAPTPLADDPTRLLPGGRHEGGQPRPKTGGQRMVAGYDFKLIDTGTG